MSAAMAVSTTTTCDTCGNQAHLVLDQVFELRVMRVLVCPYCAERLVRLKTLEEASRYRTASGLGSAF
jgi:protein-arginine kinase activator protein McsA